MIWWSLAAALIAAAATGCSSEKKRQVVSGTVSNGGRPLPPCFIRFHGSDGILTTTSVKPDGTFTMTDVFPGEYKVTFQLEVEKGEAKKSKELKPAAAHSVQVPECDDYRPHLHDHSDTNQIAIEIK